jgi:hypothetical protein
LSHCEVKIPFSGIKKYIVGLIIKTSSDAATLEAEKVYLNKLNMILVQVRAEILFLPSNCSHFQCRC